MTILVLLLRGLRSRALLSVATLVLMVVAVGGTVLGPAFSDAVTASYTLTRVAETPDAQTALTFDASPGEAGSLADLGEAAATAVRARLPASYADPEVTFEVGPTLREGDGAEFRFVARDGSCGLLEVQGRCPRSTDEVLLNRDDLGNVRLGERTAIPGLGRPVVVGSYVTPDDSDDWLLPGRLASRPSSASLPSRKGAIIVTASTLETLPRSLWTVRLDSRLQVPERFADDDLDTLVADVDRERAVQQALPGGGTLTGDSEVNALGSVLVDVRAQRDAARATMTPAVASLALLALAIILRLVAAAAALRAPQLALATLRGVGTRRTWLLGLAEPWFLVLLAAPLGVLGGYAATRVLAASWLRPGTVVGLPTGSWVGAVLVVAAIAAVAALVVGRGLRESLGSQVAGVRRPAPAGAGRSGLVLEVVVVVLAAALPLVRLGTDADGLGLTELMLPVVTAIATGLVVTRGTAVLAGWWTRRGIDGPLSVFVAARALARRAEGTLVILPVAAAIAVAVFAAGISGVADRWRGSLAATTTPAAEVWASPLDADATVRLTREVDPEGRWTAGAATIGSDAAPVVLVDAVRLGAVAAWSDQWLGGQDAAAAAALVAPATPLLRLTGTELGLTGAVVGATAGGGIPQGAGASVVLSVADGGPGLDFVRLGPFTSTPSTATTTTDLCRATCEVRQVRVEGDLGGDVVLRLSDLTVDGRAVGSALTDPRWTAATDPDPGVGSPDTGSPAPGPAEVRPAEVDAGALVVEPGVELVPALVADPVPVLVGVDADVGDALELPGTAVPVAAAPERAESLPFVGPAGVLADLPTFLTRNQADPALVSSSVLVGPGAPDSVRRSLTDAGLTRTATLDATRRALDDGAYAQALRLYGVVGAVLLLMALGGLLVSSAVQLPARRRDAAALRVVGVRRRTVVLASFWESVVALGAAALAGLGAGLLAQVVLLRSLTLGLVDDPATPRVQPQVDGGGLLLLAGGVALVLLAVATLGAGAAVRGARGATLREDAR